MHTLLDRNNFSSRTNGQVAARRVTGLIIKRLLVFSFVSWMKLYKICQNGHIIFIHAVVC